MIKKNFSRIVLLYFAAACIFFAGCSYISAPDATEIAEISLNNGGGQMSYGYRITFRRDGTAEYEGSVPPDERGKQKPSGTFPKEKLFYRGAIKPEQFDALARLIKENGFFSMPARFGGIHTGGDQTTTAVALSGGNRKEVSAQHGQGDEKLSVIELNISQTANQIKWEKK